MTIKLASAQTASGVAIIAPEIQVELPYEMARPTIDIDEQIDRLRAGGTLTENEVKALCEKVRQPLQADQTGSALRPTPPATWVMFSGRFEVASGHRRECAMVLARCWMVLVVGR